MRYGEIQYRLEKYQNKERREILAFHGERPEEMITATGKPRTSNQRARQKGLLVEPEIVDDHVDELLR